MIYLLIIHIALGGALVLTFIVRFYQVITAKITKKISGSLVPLLGTGLVGSGIALGLVTKSPISSVCLSSLVIISLVLIAEYVLQRLPVSNK